MRRLLQLCILGLVTILLAWLARQGPSRAASPGPGQPGEPAAGGQIGITEVTTYYVHLPLVLGPSPLDAVITRVAARTNTYRMQQGGCLTPLVVNAQLNTAAQRHSQDMALNDFFGHQGSDGSWPSDRVEAAGYNWSMLAENIAVGQTTPEAAVDAWMTSSGHRENVLNCNLKEIGVGYYYLANDPGTVRDHHYWTLTFGTPQ